MSSFPYGTPTQHGYGAGASGSWTGGTTQFGQSQVKSWSGMNTSVPGGSSGLFPGSTGTVSPAPTNLFPTRTPRSTAPVDMFASYLTPTALNTVAPVGRNTTTGGNIGGYHTANVNSYQNSTGGHNIGTTNAATIGGRVIGATNIGTTGGFRTGAANSFHGTQLGQSSGGFQPAIHEPQLGHSVGGFQSAIQQPQLGHSASGFQSAIQEPQLGLSAGGFQSAIQEPQLGLSAGGFQSAIQEPQFGRSAGGFQSAIQESQFGHNAGGFQSPTGHAAANTGGYQEFGSSGGYQKPAADHNTNNSGGFQGKFSQKRAPLLGAAPGVSEPPSSYSDAYTYSDFYDQNAVVSDYPQLSAESSKEPQSFETKPESPSADDDTEETHLGASLGIRPTLSFLDPADIDPQPLQPPAGVSAELTTSKPAGFVVKAWEEKREEEEENIPFELDEDGKAVKVPYLDVERVEVPEDFMWKTNQEVIHIVMDSDTHGYHCIICHSTLNDQTLYKHVHNTDHMKKLKLHILVDKVDPLWCDCCFTLCTNADNYSAHITGKKHKKHWKVADAFEKRSSQPVGEELDVLLKVEVLEEGDGKSMGLSKNLKKLKQEKGPYIGLRYLEEVETEGDCAPVFHCTLCKVQCDYGNHALHLTSISHYMAVLKKDYPGRAEVVVMRNNNQKKGINLLLQQEAAELEKTEGRNVELIKRKKVKLPGLKVSKTRQKAAKPSEEDTSKNGEAAKISKKGKELIGAGAWSSRNQELGGTNWQGVPRQVANKSRWGPPIRGRGRRGGLGFEGKGREDYGAEGGGGPGTGPWGESDRLRGRGGARGGRGRGFADSPLGPGRGGGRGRGRGFGDNPPRGRGRGHDRGRGQPLMEIKIGRSVGRKGWSQANWSNADSRNPFEDQQTFDYHHGSADTFGLDEYFNNPERAEELYRGRGGRGRFRGREEARFHPYEREREERRWGPEFEYEAPPVHYHDHRGRDDYWDDRGDMPGPSHYDRHAMGSPPDPQAVATQMNLEKLKNEMGSKAEAFKALASTLINSEEAAEDAFQLSSALTQALLDYRMKNLSSVRKPCS